MTANKNIAKNLSNYGGAYNGALIDSAVQEYNLKTGKLLRSWDALDHIPLGDSYASVPTNGFPWDAYHVNAIDLTGNGTFLVSMRNTWAAYLVNIDTGKIEWTLGGKRSSFKFGPGAAFQWQHDVKLQSELDGQHVRRSLLSAHRWRHLRPGDGAIARARARSSTSRRARRRSWPSTAAAASSNPNTWATRSRLRTATCSSAGARNPTSPSTARRASCCWKANFPGPDLSYRSTLQQWVGLPLSPPAGAARQADGRTTVYASWNGATQVASWRVLAGPSVAGPGASRLTVVATAAKSGFETAIPVPASYRELRGPGADCRRPGDRSFPAIHVAGGSMTIQVATDGGERAKREH